MSESLNSYSPEYQSWINMRDRCYNPNYAHSERYLGRGIKVCSRWDSFQNFYNDMGPRPAGYSLDRINNSGDYTPTNCRWADRSTQECNKYARGKVRYKGVVRVDKRNKTNPYVSDIKINGKKYHIGYFSTPEEAAEAWDDINYEWYGRVEYLNFPERKCTMVTEETSTPPESEDSIV